MASIDPELLIKLTGDQNITKIYDSFTWTLTSKLEQDLVINTADPPVRFTLADIGTSLRLVVFKSASPFTVTISKDSEIVDLEVRDFLILTPSESFTDNFDFFEVTTEETSDINVEIRIYGV